MQVEIYVALWSAFELSNRIHATLVILVDASNSLDVSYSDALIKPIYLSPISFIPKYNDH